MRTRWPRAVFKKFNLKTLNESEIEFLDNLFGNLTIRDKCWIRGKDSQRYTRILYNGKQTGSHRVSYELLTGEVLKHQGCHHCDIPACINPDHIFDGTQSDNIQDARNKGRMPTSVLESSAETAERNRILHEHQMGRSAFPIASRMMRAKGAKIYSQEEIEYRSNPLNMLERIRKLTESNL